MWKDLFIGKELMSLKSFHGVTERVRMLSQNRAIRELGWSLNPEFLLPTKTESHYPAKGQEGFPAAISPIWTKTLYSLTSASLLLPGGVYPIPKSFVLGTVRWDNGEEKKKCRSLASKEQNKRSVYFVGWGRTVQHLVSCQSSGPGLWNQAKEMLPQRV